MNPGKLYAIAGAIVLALLAIGAAGALPNRPLSLPARSVQAAQLEAASPATLAATSSVTSTISYQGRLTDAGGGLVNGNRNMRFIIFDDPAAGAALWDSGAFSVPVQDGLFSVQLAVDPAVFNGQALWLSIQVAGETLSPRQEILPAAYALGLRPGADIVGDSIAAGDAVLAGYALATGAALYADANGGAGVVGDSEETYGVWGSSDNGWGGYFTSTNGYGVRVTTTGAAHWDHGAYINANGGYGVYAQSTNNVGVRAEAGNIPNVSQPGGRIGVVGLGENRGVYGGSINSTGVYGVSASGFGVYGSSADNYGGYFRSDNYRSLYSSSHENYYAGYFDNRGGLTRPGIYVNGSIIASGSKAGYVVDVARNAGPDELELGDVVAVVGVDGPVLGEIPVMRVVKATADNGFAVVGVVDQRFLVQQDEEGEQFVQPDGAAASYAAGTGIQAEEYVSIVTLGAYKQIKADASFGSIQPGDLLTPSPNPGYAMRAADPKIGTIIGKALAPLESGQGTLPVYVTVQ